MKKITNRYEPYQMREIVSFSSLENSPNQYTGMMIPSKVFQFKKHFARIKATMNQRYQTYGTEYEKTFNIAIRHDKRLEDYLIATINDKDYRIIDISFDDSTYISYDILTLKRYEGNSANG